ncbi:RNA polymerase sigma factor [Terrabacter sp. NPDC080008]|uniref:RNA polymerase sigma factor n=1 Tax=Terrabacter sp. NPDC080008 TaxID=3155176 RepID=UPI00344C998B
MTLPDRGGIASQAMPGSDRELWSRLAVVDERALTALFRRHSDAVYNFAFRRTTSWSTAEDVVQATFTSLWRRARQGTVDELRAESALAVLLVMAGHECTNAVRSARRQRLLVGRMESVAGATATGDHALDTATRVDDERRMSEVRRALGRIPAAQREAIELVVWSGCSLAEAAVALGVPEGTLKSRLHRARRSLSGIIEIAALKEALS